MHAKSPRGLPEKGSPHFAFMGEHCSVPLPVGGRGHGGLIASPRHLAAPPCQRYNSLMAADELTHLDESGRARMVDVGEKPATDRWAKARGAVILSRETLAAAQAGDLKKGDLRGVAQLAGIMAAKKTAELIPLCHPLALTQVDVRVEFDETLPGIQLEAVARANGPTGVEMEALTAVAVAALTIYDMLKALERGARITDIRLVEKHGGRSGDVVLE